MDVVERDRTEPAGQRSGAGRGSRLRRVLPLLVGLAAVLGSAVLPLAPVEMSVPTVTWPQDPRAPQSTMLQLTNQEPLDLDVRFSCAAVAAAAATPEGVVVSTLLPSGPAAGTEGLLVTAREGELRILSRGHELLSAPVPGDGEGCGYRIRTTAEELVVERDGVQVAATGLDDGPDALPDVDVLATSVRELPGDDDLSVRLTVDNQFNATPSAAKQVVLAVVLLAAVGALLLLRRADRRGGVRERAPAPRPGRRVLLVDVVVVGALLAWWFIAPMSDDDGYYAQMARNVAEEGFVGNYYQLLNQSFTPFTWLYRVLGWWQQVGDSPVVLRVPALLVGLGTWVLLRRYVARAGVLPEPVDSRRGVRLALVALLGAVFLAWWLPYGMGVRPEAVVGFLALAALAGVRAGLRDRRLLPVGLAFAAAGLAVACHPTGLVALAPFLVALPGLARLVGEGADRLQVATRTALLLAPGAFAVAAAFADGTLNDFRRGQEIFLSVQEQTSWYDEIQRYGFLLTGIPMGSYARRAAVLLGMAGLVWFLVVAVAARARRVPVPASVLLAGTSLAAAFGLLWITPSKWTHHFGALSGLGPLFLALFLVSAPALVGRLADGRRPAPWVGVLAVGSTVLVIALAFHGPNTWAYTWAPGMPHNVEPPFVGPVSLDSPLVWLVVALVLLGLVARWRGRGGLPAWVLAVPLLVAVFLAGSLTYLLGSFGYATARTLDGWSPWADAVSDPLGRDCGAAAALQVTDLSAARPLPAVGAAGAADGFVEGEGWFPAVPPPGPVGSGVTSEVWGSLPAPGQEDLTGEIATPWFALPDLGDDEAVVVLAAGLLGGGNSLVAEYGTTAEGEQPRVVGSEELGDGDDDPAWRTFRLAPDELDGGRADAVRLVARDVSGGAGGWLAFTGPSAVPLVPAAEYLPADAPVALAWQTAFLFPCQEQPVVRWGITEPAEHAILWRPGPDADGMDDNTWQVFRGGVFAPVRRTSGITELDTTVPSSPGVADFQVFSFDVPYPVDAYDLTVERVTRTGLSGPPGRGTG